MNVKPTHFSTTTLSTFQPFYTKKWRCSGVSRELFEILYWTLTAKTLGADQYWKLKI